MSGRSPRCLLARVSGTLRLEGRIACPWRVAGNSRCTQRMRGSARASISQLGWRTAAACASAGEQPRPFALRGVS